MSISFSGGECFVLSGDVNSLQTPSGAGGVVVRERCL